MREYRVLLLIAYLLLCRACAFAGHAQPGHAAFDYTRHLWTELDGLPESTVQALAETPDGRLWVGTTGGLANFGGTQIRPFTPSRLESLGIHGVFCLIVDRDGSLWAGTEGAGLLHVRGAHVDVFSSAEGLTDAFVRTLFQDHTGTVWVGTDNGLFRRVQGRLQRVDDRAGLPAMAVHSIAQDREGSLWVGGSRLVQIAPDGTPRVYELPGAYSKNRVKRILQTVDGTLWVGTVGGLQRRVQGRFEAVPGIRTTVRSLLQANDGTLWIGTIGEGLWRYKDGSLSRLDRDGLLPSQTVLTLLQDDEGQIWAGTQAGLVRFSRTPIHVVSLPGVGDPDFETVSGDRQGHVWVAAQKLFLIKDGSAREVRFSNLPQISIRNVFRGRDGSLWLGTDGSGAFRVDGQSIRHFSAPGSLTNNFVRGFLQSRDGAVWIATDEGVTRISGDDTHNFTQANGLAYFSTRCLLEDHDGGIWIGTDRGVSLWREGVFQSNTVTAVLAHAKVWSILQDRQGVLWFATRDHGLYRWRGGHFDQYTTAQGLPSNSFYDLLQDRRGVFWLTGPDIVASAGEAQMDHAGSPQALSLSVRRYTMPFWAENAQMYGGRQPAGFLTSDGVFWFPTTSGAASIDTTRTLPAARLPRPLIMAFAEDGRTLPVHSGLDVPAAITRLSLGFTTLSLAPQTGIRYRYRLEPLEKTWSTAGTEDTANYTNLSAGRYRFRVQAFEESDPQAVDEADLSFVKAPYFYQTLWFYALVVIAAASFIWSLYRMRLGRIHTRFEAVLTERNRLAREMHDTVIQGCTGISALLEAIASSQGKDPQSDGTLLAYARQQIRATIDEARQAVWDMRHEEKEVDLLPAMRGLAEQTMREHGGAVTVRTPSESLPLRSSAAHEILMTVREAVYNAVQHSRSHRIEVSAEERRGELTVRIADFGQGFEDGSAAHSPDGHFGLTGMRERMKRLGGRFELQSAPGGGTTVILRLRHTKHMRPTA